MRGVGAVIFAGVPSAVALPIPVDPIMIDGVPIATDKLVAAIVAAACIAVVGVFYRCSRTGLALQASRISMQPCKRHRLLRSVWCT